LRLATQGEDELGAGTAFVFHLARCVPNKILFRGLGNLDVGLGEREEESFTPREFSCMWVRRWVRIAGQNPKQIDIAG